MTLQERNEIILDLRRQGRKLDEIEVEMCRRGFPIAASTIGKLCRKHGLQSFKGRVPDNREINHIPTPSRGVANPDKVFAERMGDREYQDIKRGPVSGVIPGPAIPLNFYVEL